MSRIKLFLGALTSMSIFLMSCSGDDSGSVSLIKQGIAKTEMSNNNQADIKEFEYSLEFLSDYSQLNLDLGVYIDEPFKYGYLFYIEHKSGFRYYMPGYLWDDTHFVTVEANTLNGEV
ncbi:hypothetical protein [Allomuricauda sp.]|uniref:hypothetical protein n=1 Tax=Flagellimonas alginolytica TaxID=3177515 RepID=UPI0025EEB14E|nr:hypothetical protein [Allomuricauda sp.]